MADPQGQVGLGVLTTLLAKNLADIPDLPQYKTPFPGVYKLIIESVSPEEIAKKSALKVTYVVSDVVSLSENMTPELMVANGHKEQLVAPGDKFSEAFFFDDPDKIETTISALKLKYGGLAEACGTQDLSEILTKMVGFQIQCIITNRLDKNDKSKIYPNTKEIVLAA